MQWLVGRSELDPTTVDPVRYVCGLVDVLAAIMDAGEPDDVVKALGVGEPTEHLALIEGIWRVDHPRLTDVLDMLGTRHPVKAVAKAARKALVRHRSRLANHPATPSS